MHDADVGKKSDGEPTRRVGYMCRVLGYLGPPVLLADLVTRPANSLVNQSFDPEQHDYMQLGGTGFASWEKGAPDEARPLVYKSARAAFYDTNLHNLCAKLHTTNLLAHIRATGYEHHTSINDDNCHPFIYPNVRMAMAHNGGLPGWRNMLPDILTASEPGIASQLTGSTDTELLYCLLMSQYEDPSANMEADEIIHGLSRFMQKLIEIKRKQGNARQAKLKLFLADGDDLVVANLGLGFDYAQDIEAPWEQLLSAPRGSPERQLAGVVEPAYYHAGRGYGRQNGHYGMEHGSSDDVDAVIVSSEPLTSTSQEWRRVDFQHVVFFRRTNDACSVRVQKLIF